MYGMFESKTILVATRFAPSEAELIHDWRRQQPRIPTASEAIRELVRRGLSPKIVGQLRQFDDIRRSFVGRFTVAQLVASPRLAQPARPRHSNPHSACGSAIPS
jgi:hypothetical protein